MEEAILAELGFSPRETKVYLALLDLGQTTVGPVAAKTRLQHSKVYQTLEKLLDRGLVSFVIRSKTKYFQAESPRHILKGLKEKERLFLEVLPVLEKRRDFSIHPQLATVYEGFKAIKTMYENVVDELGSKDYYFVFAFREEYSESPDAVRFLRKLHMRMADKKVDDRAIAHTSIRKQVLDTYQGLRTMKIRFSPLKFPLGLVIVKGKIINFSWGGRPTAVEIVSEQIAEQYKNFFMDMWKIAK